MLLRRGMVKIRDPIPELCPTMPFRKQLQRNLTFLHPSLPVNNNSGNDDNRHGISCAKMEARIREMLHTRVNEEELDEIYRSVRSFNEDASPSVIRLLSRLISRKENRSGLEP